MCTAHMYLGYGSFAVSLPAWVLGVRFAYFYIESGDLVPNIEMASAWASGPLANTMAFIASCISMGVLTSDCTALTVTEFFTVRPALRPGQATPGNQSQTVKRSKCSEWLSNDRVVHGYSSCA